MKNNPFYTSLVQHITPISLPAPIKAAILDKQFIKENPDYYLKYLKNGKNNLLKLKKKPILAFFPTHKSILEKYVKKHKLKWNSEKDLIRLFTYYEDMAITNALSSTGQE